MRPPIPSTASGLSLSTNLFRSGISTDLKIRPRGSASNTPKGAAVRILTFLWSSVALAALARSLASPAIAPTPSTAAAVPPATVAGIAEGAIAAAPAAAAPNPAIEPSALPMP